VGNESPGVDSLDELRHKQTGNREEDCNAGEPESPKYRPE
jgi:hypothetical protein